ncbi:hypothetical protein LCGC14_0125140 [marine sediment metagenome]|uniref:FAD-binding FR-type domain-containing protein n=1 Tax=marine sediment metagenome TaxID=412755 RepID=A0A0F9V9Q1_9ZZZZ
MSEPSVKKRGSYLAEVLANEVVCDDHGRLILDVAHFPPTAPGQFIQLMCRPPTPPEAGRAIEWRDGQTPQFTQAELLDSQPLLRRPFSIAGRREHAGGASELDIVYCVKGVGTRWLAGVNAGQSLSVLGPLGNSFVIRRDKPAAALVGGGVGIPPLLYLAEQLATAGKETVAFIGARSADRLPLRLLPNADVRTDGAPSHCAAELAAYGVETAIATDDGSLGMAGVVGEAFGKWLDGSAVSAENVVVYSCGPEAMMEAVALMSLAAGAECQLSLERYMACGMGTCQSCVCKLRDDSAQGWAYKLCCADGPVFDAAQIVWD